MKAGTRLLKVTMPSRSGFSFSPVRVAAALLLFGASVTVTVPVKLPHILFVVADGERVRLGPPAPRVARKFRSRVHHRSSEVPSPFHCFRTHARCENPHQSRLWLQRHRLPPERGVFRKPSGAADNKRSCWHSANSTSGPLGEGRCQA